MSADLASLQRELSAISSLAKQNPKDKHYAYQHKILQLLLREKTAQLTTSQLAAQLSNSQNELSKARRDVREMEAKWERDMNAVRREVQEARVQGDRLRAEGENWRALAEEAEMEAKLARMAKMEIEEQQEEIASMLKELQTQAATQIATNEQQQKQIEILTLALANERNTTQKQTAAHTALQERVNSTEELLKQIQSGKSTAESAAIASRQEIIALKAACDSQLRDLEALKVERGELQRTESRRREQADRLDARRKELQRENLVLKERQKEMEKDLHCCQTQKATLENAVKRLEKESKKYKEDSKEWLAKEKDHEEEMTTLTEKARSLQRQLRTARKDNEQLKDSLAALEEHSGNEAARLKRWEAATKSHRLTVAELEAKLESLTEELKEVKSKLEESERGRIEVSLLAERTAKEKQVLSEMNQQLEERRVLWESEREKAITALIKDKDVFSRANFKLLQLLELKDQTIRTILAAVEKGEAPTDPTTLLSDQLTRSLLSPDTKLKLLDPQQRLKYLSEWLKSPPT